MNKLFVILTSLFLFSSSFISCEKEPELSDNIEGYYNLKTWASTYPDDSVWVSTGFMSGSLTLDKSTYVLSYHFTYWVENLYFENMAIFKELEVSESGTYKIEHVDYMGKPLLGSDTWEGVIVFYPSGQDSWQGDFEYYNHSNPLLDIDNITKGNDVKRLYFD